MKAQPQPVAWTLNCQLKYQAPSEGDYTEKRAIFQMVIPASRGLVRKDFSEDDVATYMGANAQTLSAQKAGQLVGGNI